MMKDTNKDVSAKAASSSYLSPRNLLRALLYAVLITACGFLIDHLFHNANRLLASDFYTCGVAFLFSYVLLQLEARRRAALARRVEIAAEVNHHIRNALTGVIYTAAVRNDPALQAVLEDATARIDWVLNTVLPDGASHLRWPVQLPPNWRPSSWTSGQAKSDKVSPRTANQPTPLPEHSTNRRFGSG